MLNAEKHCCVGGFTIIYESGKRDDAKQATNHVGVARTAPLALLQPITVSRNAKWNSDSPLS